MTNLELKRLEILLAKFESLLKSESGWTEDQIECIEIALDIVSTAVDDEEDGE